MTTQPVDDRLDRTPTWMVQGVFDPDVKGQNFSYTIGLHDRGLPELHLWASPTDGHDPGDDWAFSHNDRCHILNELAFAMIDGRLGPGSTVVKKYDQGHATVTFDIQPPGDRDALEALGIATEAHALAEATLAVLSLEAVADLADPNLRLSARGPWIAAFDPGRAIPGPAWSAAPTVVRAVRKLLRPLALHEWSAIVTAHHGADELYRALCTDLELRYFTTASGIPWSKLTDLPAGREFRHLQHQSKEWHGMVEWASCLATLLTYRTEYSAEDVVTFVAPVRELLPDLERVVNAVR